MGLAQAAVVIVFGALSAASCQAEEISLFNASGEAVAYTDEELTIYLWSGKPVAYLDD